ncbi:hypothetical protein NEOLEDRAFT_750551 [Neolentinus lepideus HHB14362 ss-1]|uniref:Uncharacterized protein n=1 Tax=Neolentinus lepideus HHB14362 ss-1 TaxID=1314782 RepID=A0A165PU41_9AGAM|nr:hypothetical protein NEOLEDRAFT_750551 [Neolentinus lepideus HHB14362 ss-1]
MYQDSFYTSCDGGSRSRSATPSLVKHLDHQRPATAGDFDRTTELATVFLSATIPPQFQSMATSSPTHLQNATVEDSRTALEDFQALQASLEEIVSCMIRDEEQVALQLSIEEEEVAKQLSIHLNELRVVVEEIEHEITIMDRLLSVAPEDAIAGLRRIYEESGPERFRSLTPLPSGHPMNFANVRDAIWQRTPVGFESPLMLWAPPLHMNGDAIPYPQSWNLARGELQSGEVASQEGPPIIHMDVPYIYPQYRGQVPGGEWVVQPRPVPSHAGTSGYISTAPEGEQVVQSDQVASQMGPPHSYGAGTSAWMEVRRQ